MLREALALVVGWLFAGAALGLQRGIGTRLWLTGVIAAFFLVAYAAKRRTPILVASIAWALEGAWEMFLRIKMGEDYHDFNIRLDLLFIVLPAVVLSSAIAGAVLVWPTRDSDTTVG